ncbi:MAG: exosortase/archaeosortase family protein [Lentisphaeria bacterium]|nr:exosortase/archaeosortase family protein [Lentisphaeria bacterium]
MKIFLKRLEKHPLGALYGTLLGIIAFSAAVPMFASGMYDAGAIDLAMAGILIAFMLRKFIVSFRRESDFIEKCIAWVILIIVNILALLPTQEFPGSLSTAVAFSLLICAFVLYFSGSLIAAICVAPTVWCCVFMPYHEEFMLMLSFPLRVSATVLSAGILKLCGIGVVYSGTSLTLPGLNIAITDACSGINQLDAFILIACIAVQILHKKTFWKVLHFAFIIPSIIAGNALRIVLTVLLYNWLGESVLQNTWHTGLGYVQIILALAIFLLFGKMFQIEKALAKEEQE